MSYDISVVDLSGNVIELDHRHFLRGGTYALGGDNQAALNITYNYAPHFRRVWGAQGIRIIYGMSVAASLPVLTKALSA